MVQDPKSESPSPSKPAEETPVDIDQEIKENMGAGKKHLLCSDYPDAVACFQEACKLLSQKHGQLSEECSDAYYYYGLSLLELARLENGVLGNALKGVPDEDEESDKDDEQFEKPNLPEGDREKLREDVEAAMATEDEEEEGEEADKKEEGQKPEEQKPEEKAEETKEEKTSKEPEEKKEEKEEKIEASEKAEPEPKSAESEPSCSKSEQSKEGGEEEEGENPDDISSMQLAWEMLELARVLYQKREKNKDNILMVAQCHLKLGELGLEGEQYQQAIGDFLECLVIQKEHLAETDRKLAETYYNLGLAYSFEKRYDNALEHYQNALNVLEARVDLLEELIDSKEGQSEEADLMAECKEVGEIKELIPDINSKIEDVLSVKKQNEGKREGSPFRQALGETTTGFGAASSSSSGASCSTIPVRKVTPSSTKESTSDISHLVRRKRSSPDEEGSATEADGESKKPKQEENSSNGHSSEKNGGPKNGNGDHTSPEKKDENKEDAATALKKKIAAAGDAPVAMET